MSIYGLSFVRRFVSVMGRVLMCSFIGLMIGLIVDILLINNRYFSLPFDLLYLYIGVFFALGIVMIGLMAFIVALGIRKVNVGEVVRAV